jgi:hypothetical protein
MATDIYPKPNNPTVQHGLEVATFLGKITGFKLDLSGAQPTDTGKFLCTGPEIYPVSNWLLGRNRLNSTR